MTDLRSIPHIDQYNGPWAMHEPHLRAIEALVQDKKLLELHMTEQASVRIVNDAAPKDPYAFEVIDGIARLQIKGMMTKYGSSFAGEYVGNVRMQRMVRNAGDDSLVQGVLLMVESGGGSTLGVDDLAAEFASLRKRKPTATVYQEIGASAAMYVGSQTGRSFAHPSAFIGGIGTYGVVEDWSKHAEQLGVKVHVVRAGQFKGMGTKGTEITTEQLDEIQRNISNINELFIAAVMRGRGWNREVAEKLADGRVHIAAEARKLGFIDAVGTESDAVAWLRSQIQAESKKGKTMEGEGRVASAAGTVTAPPVQTTRAATLKELKAAFPKAGDSFYVACQDADMTIEQAQQAYTSKIEKELEASQADARKLREEAAAKVSPNPAAGKGGVGVQPAEVAAVGTKFDGDPIVAWNKAIGEEMERTKDRAKAVSAVVRKNPELHKAYLDAVNKR